MPRLTIARIASDTMLGTDVYQHEVISRASDALPPTDWQVNDTVVRSLRSPLPGTHRLPLGKLTTAPAAVRRLAGRALYPRDAVVHRMSLELPPSPHADVLTLHDVVAWKYPDESAPVPAAKDEIRRAAGVICVSAFSAGEAVDLLGIDPPHVVHNGVDATAFGTVARLPRRDTLRVAFLRPQRAVTPGQSVVLYQGEACLGGAVIASTDAPAAHGTGGPA